MKKLKFYLFGLVPGLILVFFILNKKGASCSGYLPNSRVIAETLSKKFTYLPEVEKQMSDLKIDEKFLKDSIITNAYVDFSKSHAQKKPCPKYLITSPKDHPLYEVHFEKCNDDVKILSFKKLR